MDNPPVLTAAEQEKAYQAALKAYQTDVDRYNAELAKYKSDLVSYNESIIAVRATGDASLLKPRPIPPVPHGLPPAAHPLGGFQDKPAPVIKVFALKIKLTKTEIDGQIYDDDYDGTKKRYEGKNSTKYQEDVFDGSQLLGTQDCEDITDIEIDLPTNLKDEAPVYLEGKFPNGDPFSFTGKYQSRGDMVKGEFYAPNSKTRSGSLNLNVPLPAGQLPSSGY